MEFYEQSTICHKKGLFMDFSKRLLGFVHRFDTASDSYANLLSFSLLSLRFHGHLNCPFRMGPRWHCSLLSQEKTSFCRIECCSGVYIGLFYIHANLHFIYITVPVSAGPYSSLLCDFLHSISPSWNQPSFLLQQVQ